MKLCDYEVKVLRECNGEQQQGLAWGAAMGAAVETLEGAGLIERKRHSDGCLQYWPTAKGRAYLAEAKP